MSGIVTGPKGIDISKWQATTPSLVGLDFLIARASIGTRPDEKYRDHIRAAKAEGLVTGAYHFNWSTIPVSDQIEAFLEAAGDVDLYFIDVEYAGNGVRQFTKAQTRDFIKGVRLAKGHCGLYMSESGYYTDVANDYRWVANWSQPPSIGWKFWQYQGSPLDKNRFNGTEAELRALAGEPEMTPRAITSTTAQQIVVRDGVNVYDLDGKTLLFSNPVHRDWRQSPYEAGSTPDGRKWRAWYVDPDGSGAQPTRVVLSAIMSSDIRAVPDSTPHDDADITAAKAEQKSADQAAIDAANAAAAEATAALAVAAEAERERIAIALGKQEADRVRATAP